MSVCDAKHKKGLACMYALFLERKPTMNKLKRRIMKPVVSLCALFVRDKERRRLFKKNILLDHAIHLPGYSYIIKPFRMENPNTRIGRYVSIAHNVQLGLAQHPLDVLSTSPKIYGKTKRFVQEGRMVEPIIIDNDIWIGASVIVLNGVHIGPGAVVAAGAVVTKDVPPYAIVGGVPARVIRYRFEPKVIKELLASQWWNLPDNEVQKLPFDDVSACLKQLAKGQKKSTRKKNLP